MSETVINGIVFKGSLADIQRVRNVKKDEDRTDLLADAMIARSQGRRLNRFQEARLAEWDYEQGAMVAELLDQEEAEAEGMEEETHKLLCKYRGVVYMLPEHRRKLIQRIRAEIMAHWTNKNGKVN